MIPRSPSEEVAEDCHPQVTAISMEKDNGADLSFGIKLNKYLSASTDGSEDDLEVPETGPSFETSSPGEDNVYRARSPSNWSRNDVSIQAAARIKQHVSEKSKTNAYSVKQLQNPEQPTGLGLNDSPMPKALKSKLQRKRTETPTRHKLTSETIIGSKSLLSPGGENLSDVRLEESLNASSRKIHPSKKHVEEPVRKSTSRKSKIVHFNSTGPLNQGLGSDPTKKRRSHPTTSLTSPVNRKSNHKHHSDPGTSPTPTLQESKSHRVALSKVSKRSSQTKGHQKKQDPSAKQLNPSDRDDVSVNDEGADLGNDIGLAVPVEESLDQAPGIVESIHAVSHVKHPLGQSGTSTPCFNASQVIPRSPASKWDTNQVDVSDEQSASSEPDDDPDSSYEASKHELNAVPLPKSERPKRTVKARPERKTTSSKRAAIPTEHPSSPEIYHTEQHEMPATVKRPTEALFDLTEMTQNQFPNAELHIDLKLLKRVASNSLGHIQTNNVQFLLPDQQSLSKRVQKHRIQTQKKKRGAINIEAELQKEKSLNKHDELSPNLQGDVVSLTKHPCEKGNPSDTKVVTRSAKKRKFQAELQTSLDRLPKYMKRQGMDLTLAEVQTPSHANTTMLSGSGLMQNRESRLSQARQSRHMNNEEALPQTQPNHINKSTSFEHSAVMYAEPLHPTSVPATRFSEGSTLVSPTPKHRQQEAVQNEHRNEALRTEGDRHILQDAIVNVAMDAVLRLGIEEDAIRTKSDNYGRGVTHICKSLKVTCNKEYKRYALKLQEQFLKQQEDMGRAMTTSDSTDGIADLTVKMGNLVDSIDQQKSLLLARLADVGVGK